MNPPDAPREHIDNESVASYIRPLALVVFRREDGRILVAPGFDHVKQQRFYRPLGGGIEFGERAEDAARREILEELGAAIDGPTLLGTFENIFTYRGQQGHELIWLYEARFADASFYEREVVEADESGAKFEAHWVALDVFERGDAPLYPEGLLPMLREPEGYHEAGMLILVEKPKLTHVRLLVVSDFGDCFRFYHDVMGFEAMFGDESGPYADFDAHSIKLALFKRDLMAQAIGAPNLSPRQMLQDTAALVFEVVDVESAMNQLEKRGAVFLTEPTDRPDWGIRTVHLRDPDGNLIELNEELRHQ
jgi:predicted enzyme related to lactoylglutathione lyase/ADP-ribose pyrophosphatase YjhB (NUDIX family)